MDFTQPEVTRTRPLHGAVIFAVINRGASG